jgi:aminopeptidase N
MVLDARFAPSEYVEFALANLGAESGEGIVPQVLNALQQALRYLQLVDVAGPYVATLQRRVEDFLWEEAVASDAGSDRQIALFDAYVETASSPASAQRLADMLAERMAPPAGLNLDQDRRWNVLETLAEGGHAGIDDLITAERLRDPSDQGRLRSLAAEAARPSLDVKRDWLRRVIGEPTLSLADARAAGNALFPARQHALRSQLSDEILAGLQVVNRSRDQSYFAAFVGGFLGVLCEPEYLRRLDAAIEESADLHPILLRGLRNTRFEVARCISIGEIERQKKSPIENGRALQGASRSPNRGGNR